MENSLSVNTRNILQISPASWRDTRAFYDLEKACFPMDAWPLWDVIAVLTFPNIVRFKAVFKQQLVGFIIGDRRPGQNIGWIATFGVAPKFRNQGIGAELLKTCEEALNRPRIRLSVRPSNETAIRLYRQHGYTSVGTWRKYYKGGEDALIMEKTLQT